MAMAAEQERNRRGEEGAPGGEGLPEVPGGWKVVYAAPDRLAAIRIQGILEELGFTTYILEEAMGFVAPLASYSVLPEISPLESDSHLVAPAREADRVVEVLRRVLEEIAAFEGEQEEDPLPGGEGEEE